MSHISLNPKNLEFEMGASSRTGETSLVTIEAALRYPQPFFNQQGTDLYGMPWVLTVLDEATPQAIDKPGGSIGNIRYHAAMQYHSEASCRAVISLKATHFARLLSMAQAGHIPSAVELQTEGTVNSGTSVLWDMRSTNVLPIYSVTFRFVHERRRSDA